MTHLLFAAKRPAHAEIRDPVGAEQSHLRLELRRGDETREVEVGAFAAVRRGYSLNELKELLEAKPLRLRLVIHARDLMGARSLKVADLNLHGGCEMTLNDALKDLPRPAQPLELKGQAPARLDFPPPED